jgi:hypothetical protein
LLLTVHSLGGKLTVARPQNRFGLLARRSPPVLPS